MDQTNYLERINYRGELQPSLAVLGDLQKAHLLTVPFENLDVQMGTPIKLHIDRIYSKIVTARRGGFCYELNGLYFELLRSIGFKAKRISARVFDPSQKPGPEFDHLAIIVSIDGKDYLTDVGFGEFAFHPLRLVFDKVQSDQRGEFRIERHKREAFQVSAWKDEWNPVYLFSVVPREFEEYQDMCHYHQSSPESHFTQKRLCSLPTENGRITLSGNSITLEDGSTRGIKDNDQLATYLWTCFGIKL